MQNKWQVYRKLKENEFIVVGVDTSAGAVDYCAAQFISITNKDVPIVYHDKVLASEMTPEIFNMLVEIYYQTGVKPIVAYERNNGGVFELEHLQQMNKLNQFNIYQTKTNTGTIRGTQQGVKLGWDTTSSSRMPMLASLKEAIDNFYLTIYDEPTLSELFSFVVVQSATTSTWRAQAEHGAHDDLLMSLGIAWQMYQTESTTRGKSAIVRPHPPNEKPKAPYVENDRLIGVSVESMIEKIIKENTNRAKYKDWKYR